MAKLLSKPGIAKHVTWSMNQLTQEQQETQAVQGRGNRNPTHAFEYSIDYQAIKQSQVYDGYSAMNGLKRWHFCL